MAFAIVDDGDADTPERRVSGCATGANADRCLRLVYAGAVERGEVASTLAALEDVAERGQLDDCHLEAHRLAHAVFRDVGDVERTFALGGPACRFGYLHGAVEATRGAAGVPRCSRFRIGLQRRACAHGYGHALMLRTGNDIAKSVDGCVASSLDAPACTAGVMMQASLRYAGRRDAAAAAAHDCRALARRDLERECLENVGVVAALSLGHDRRRSEAACRELTRPRERALCLRGTRDEIAETERGG